MEEKELTDEEIVKALNKTKQELANISPEDDDYDKLLTVKTIVDYCHDLIHRLQGKIGEYERKLEDGELVSKEWHDEQVLHLEEQCQQFLYDFEQQKSEIERLTSTVNRLEFADKCGRKMRALDIKENAELQKKVDELSTEKTDGFLFFSQRMKLGEICEAYFQENKILNCAQSVIGHLMRLGLLNVSKAKQYLQEKNNEKKK